MDGSWALLGGTCELVDIVYADTDTAGKLCFGQSLLVDDLVESVG